jgi:hypothetical protein
MRTRDEDDIRLPNIVQSLERIMFAVESIADDLAYFRMLREEE